jgi:hypothetical protein
VSHILISTYKTITYIILFFLFFLFFLLQEQQDNEICPNNYAMVVSAIALNWVAFNELLVIITCSTLSTLNDRGWDDMGGVCKITS